MTSIRLLFLLPASILSSEASSCPDFEIAMLKAALIADRDAMIADQDAMIADRDAEIVQLKMAAWSSCPIGTWSNFTGQVDSGTCLPCPYKMTTLSTGTTSIDGTALELSYLERDARVYRARVYRARACQARVLYDARVVVGHRHVVGHLAV